MKHIKRVALVTIAIAAGLVGFRNHTQLIDSERGDKQLSFSDNTSSLYPAYPSDSPVRRELREHERSRRPAHEENQTRVPSREPEWARNDAPNSSQLNIELADPNTWTNQSQQDGQNALRQGQAAGQVSNVPGTTSTSPNGTSNIYGTGGIPLSPPESR